MKPSHLKPLIIIAICCLGIAVYSNTFNSSFHLDDYNSITDNPAIKNIWNPLNIWNFWPTRFITYLSLAFNYHLHKLDVFGYHLFNLAVHLGASILVWWLTLLTFSTPALKDQKISRYARTISFFAGLIFVAHPIQAQAVTYIVQRAVSMATLFYLASLCLYAKSRLLEYERPALGLQRSYYAASLITALMAMFTKEMAITLPVMIWLYEFSFFKDRKALNWKRLVPFILILLVIPLTMLLTKSVDFVHMRRTTEFAQGISPWHYLLTQFKVIATYIRLAFLPLNQNIDYDYPVAKTLMDFSVIAGIALISAIFIFAVRISRNYRLISFGIFWFFLALLPESGFIPIKDVIFEHRLYLSMAGYSIFLVSGLYYLFKEKRIKLTITILGLLVISYSILAYQRNGIFKDEFTLWNDVIRKSPLKARPYNNRGFDYFKKNDLERAIDDFNKAIEIDPKYAEAYNNRGIVYGKKNDLERAIDDFNKAIAIYPGYAKAYNSRGIAYFKKGGLGQAVSDFSKAIEIDPGYAAAYHNRAAAYLEKKQYDEAWADALRSEALGYAVNPEFLESLKKASGREK